MHAMAAWVPSRGQRSSAGSHAYPGLTQHVLRQGLKSGYAQALEHDKANDLMFWASSYNLFVSWSVNGQHPWDMLPAANKPAATLEIGSLRGAKDKVPCPLAHVSNEANKCQLVQRV